MDHGTLRLHNDEGVIYIYLFIYNTLIIVQPEYSMVHIYLLALFLPKGILCVFEGVAAFV